MEVRTQQKPKIIDVKTSRSSVYLQANPEQVLTRSRRHVGLSKLTVNVPLPPINRSRSVTGKVEHSAAESIVKKTDILKGYSTILTTCNTMKDNLVLDAFVHPYGQPCLKLNKKISVYHVAANKADTQYPTTHGRLIKQSFDAQPAVTLIPAPVNPSERLKENDASDPGANAKRTMMPDRVKHDAILHEVRQQRGFCSDDSAIETESGDRSNSDRLKEDSDDDYYTDQKITEWVLKVNSTFFSTGNDKVDRYKPIEEQDMATIKIVYSGD